MLRRITHICLVLCLLAPAAASGHAGSLNFLSEVKSVDPAVEGVSVEVLNRDDRLLMRVPDGVEAEVEGYSEEPYVRFAADGTVSVNTNSPAYYLNQDRYQGVEAPEGLEDEAPEWKQVSEVGRYEWHDHRMHWMGKGDPPQVEDREVRTKVFDWTVPVRIDGEAGTIAGTLLWTPLPGSDGLPVWAIAALAVAVVGSAVAAFVVQRRRTRGPSEGSEAW